MVAGMSNLSPEQRSMMRTEELIRKALSESNPAERTQSLIQVYRFLHPSERDAFVMGLITRAAMAGMFRPAPRHEMEQL